MRERERERERERVLQQSLIVCHTPFDEQLADIMTKALPIQHFINLRTKLSVISCYTDVDLPFTYYTDANWAESVIDRRSTSGYCTFLGGNLVTWRSKKQPVVARSSAEAEFRAMAQGICELLWIKIILSDLGVEWGRSIKLYCDKKSAINIAHNLVQHDHTKHVEVDHHFIKEKLESGLICTPYVST